MERRWAKVEPGPWTPDRLPPPSDSGGFGPRLRSLAWGPAQALPEEGAGSTAPCPPLTLAGGLLARRPASLLCPASLSLKPWLLSGQKGSPLL